MLAPNAGLLWPFVSTGIGKRIVEAVLCSATYNLNTPARLLAQIGRAAIIYG